MFGAMRSILKIPKVFPRLNASNGTRLKVLKQYLGPVFQPGVIILLRAKTPRHVDDFEDRFPFLKYLQERYEKTDHRNPAPLYGLREKMREKLSVRSKDLSGKRPNKSCI